MRLSLTLVLGAALPLVGCKYYVSNPLPPVERVAGDTVVALGRDTLRLKATDRYELYAPTASALIGTMKELDETAREFQRLFGAPPPRVAVVLLETREALARLDAAPFRARGLPVVPFVRPTRLQERVARAGGPEVWPVRRPVARAFLHAYIAQKRARAISDSARMPTRLPAWLEEAIVSLAVSPQSAGFARAYLAEHLNRALPLAELLTMAAPVPRGDDGWRDSATALGFPELERVQVGEVAMEPLNPRDTPSPTLLFVMQARTLGGYLAAHEGFPFVGTVADGLLRGETLTGVLRAAARRVPPEPAALETAWREWVRGGRAQGRR